jgi:hypothetical protein
MIGILLKHVQANHGGVAAQTRAQGYSMATSVPFKWRKAKITFILLNSKIRTILLHKIKVVIFHNFSPNFTEALP